MSGPQGGADGLLSASETWLGVLGSPHRFGLVIIGRHPYDDGVPAPKSPEALRSYTASYTDAAWLKRVGPLDVLRLSNPLKTALRAYEDDLVQAARKEGRTWREIGNALGMERQNAQRRFKHLDTREGSDE